MEVLSNNEAKNYEGGGFSAAWGVFIGGVTAFFLGFVQGLVGSTSTCSR